VHLPKIEGGWIAIPDCSPAAMTWSTSNAAAGVTHVGAGATSMACRYSQATATLALGVLNLTYPQKCDLDGVQVFAFMSRSLPFRAKTSSSLKKQLHTLPPHTSLSRTTQR